MNQSYEEKKEEVSEQAVEARRDIIENTDVEKIVKDKIRQTTIAQGLIKGNDDGELFFDEDKVMVALEDKILNEEVEAIDTPIGYIPKYDDLKALFKEVIDKDYPEDLYTMQFSIYCDNIIKRIDLQDKAYHEEENIPEKFFEILKEQKAGLEALKAKNGPIVKPQDL